MFESGSDRRHKARINSCRLLGSDIQVTALVSSPVSLVVVLLGDGGADFGEVV